jgi:hypothetical protein
MSGERLVHQTGGAFSFLAGCRRPPCRSEHSHGDAPVHAVPGRSFQAKTASVLATVLAACGSDITARAETYAIPGVFGTGVDSRGELLPTGAVDPHYVLASDVYEIGVEPPALVVDDLAWRALGGPWLPNDDSSLWIGPETSVAATAPAGEYRYTISFDLAGMNHETARLQLRWAADDRGTSGHLNGADTRLSGTSAHTFSEAFTLTDGFVSGVNVLEFVVRNLEPASSSGSNPTGVRVELVGRAAL